MSAVALGFTRITGINTAAKGVFTGSITQASVSAKTWALVQAEGGSVRWRDDGTDPTASVGNLLAAGDSMQYVQYLPKLKLIAATAGASANVTFYRSGGAV